MRHLQSQVPHASVQKPEQISICQLGSLRPRHSKGWAEGGDYITSSHYIHNYLNVTISLHGRTARSKYLFTLLFLIWKKFFVALSEVSLQYIFSRVQGLLRKRRYKHSYSLLAAILQETTTVFQELSKWSILEKVSVAGLKSPMCRQLIITERTWKNHLRECYLIRLCIDVQRRLTKFRVPMIL